MICSYFTQLLLIYFQVQFLLFLLQTFKLEKGCMCKTSSYIFWTQQSENLGQDQF